MAKQKSVEMMDYKSELILRLILNIFFFLWSIVFVILGAIYVVFNFNIINIFFLLFFILVLLITFKQCLKENKYILFRLKKKDYIERGK